MKRKYSLLPKILATAFVVLTIALSAVAVWLGIWVGQLNSKMNMYHTQAENVLEDALYKTADGLTSVENNLAKLMISQSPSESAMYAADICKDAASASDAVNRLPVSQEDTVKVQKFLNQVSDFSACYLRAAAKGENLDSYNKQIEAMFKTAKLLKTHVSKITATLDGTYMIVDNVNTDGTYADLSAGGDGDTEASVDYPKIIYDGPFSDSVSETQYKAVENEREITAEQAIAVAKEKLGIENATCAGLVGHGADDYLVNGTIDGADAYVGVTKKGGLIMEIDIYKPASSINYDQEYAKKFAKDTATKLGYCDSLQSVWYNQIDGYAFVNLAPIVNDVIYYTDLVKVKVNLTDGSLLGFEARGYCSNYTTRQAVTLMNKNAIPTLISPKLTVNSIRLAVIPKGETERLCYEVAANMGGLDYFIYLDAVNGEEVEIMRVIDEDQGSMVY